MLSFLIQAKPLQTCVVMSGRSLGKNILALHGASAAGEGTAVLKTESPPKTAV
jgi:hypothetical protein